MRRPGTTPCPSCGAGLDAFAVEVTCPACDRDFVLEVDEAAGSLYRGEVMVVARPWARPAPDAGAVDVGSIAEPDLVLGRGRERLRLADGVVEWTGGVFADDTERARFADIVTVTATGAEIMVVLAAGTAWQVARGLDLSQAAREWVARRLRNAIWPVTRRV